MASCLNVDRTFAWIVKDAVRMVAMLGVYAIVRTRRLGGRAGRFRRIHRDRDALSAH